MKHQWGLGWGLAAALFASLTAGAQEYEKLLPQDLGLQVPCVENSQASESIKIPAVPKKEGVTAILAFNARAKHTTARGWGYLFSLKVNGKTVDCYRITGEMRLLARGEVMVDDYSDNPAKNHSPWFKDGRIIGFYSPEQGNRIDPHAVSAVKEGCNYQFDLSDLLSSTEENEITFGYHLRKGALKNDPELLVRDLNVVYVPNADLKQLQTVKQAEKEKDAAGRELENAYPFNREITIVPEVAGMSTARLELPAIPKKEGFVPVLRMDLRVKNSSIAGWNYYTSLKVNGRKLDKLTESGEQRLLFRSEIVEATYDSWTAAKGRGWWNSGLLVTFFAPENTTKMDAHLKSDAQEGYYYYLDLSDCIHYVEMGADDRILSSEPNVVEFGYSPAPGMLKRKAPLLIKKINVIYLPEAMLKDARPQAKLIERQPGTPAAKIALEGGTLQVDAAGGMEIVLGDDRFFLESLFSYPAQPEMQFNALAIEALKGEKAWQVQVKQISAQEIAVSARGSLYALERRIVKAGHRCNVTDAITNLSGGDLGLSIAETIANNQALRPDVRLAGLSGAKGAGNYDAGPNPSLFITGSHDSAIGLLMEDTLTRCKLEMIAKGNVLAATIPGVGLPKGDKMTLEWAIYPMPLNGDYFAFVNQVRRDWNVNMTLIGSAVSAEHQTMPATLKPGVIPVRPWFEYADGGALSREEYLKIVGAKMEALRKQYPGVVLMASLETNLVPFNAGPYDWKEELPLTYGDRSRENSVYGIYATKEATAKLDAVTPLKDSILRDKEGRAMLDSYFVYLKEPIVNLMVQPELGNSRYRQILEQIDFLVDNLHCDGLYFDQFPPKPREGYSYDRWDGRSVTLNPDGSIASKFYSYAYTGVSARVNIVKYVRSKGCLFRCNGSPVSKEEQSLGILCFHEQENSRFDPMLFLDEKPPETTSQVSAHLSPSPAIVSIRPYRYTKDLSLYPKLVMRGMIMALRNGVMPYYYNVGPDSAKVNCDFGNNCFPFTTVELHEGYLIGKERTITTLSGNYKLGGAKEPVVHFYDAEGNPQDAADHVKISGKPGSWDAAVQLKDWREAAILVVQE